MDDQRAQAFDSLSGGQRQRLFIALAFVNSPEVVFLDELTQGLDPQARRATWELIREIRQGGTTVVLVTHFMDEAEQLCDRVAVVDRGKVVALDTPQRLIDGLGLPSVVRFTTSEPDLGWLEKLDVVESMARHGEAVEIRGTGPVLALVASELVAHGIVPLDLRVDRPTVEDAFLALTGRTSGVSTMRGYLAMTRTEFRLFRREPFSVVFVLAFPLMMMMLLAAVFGNKQADAHKSRTGCSSGAA